MAYFGCPDGYYCDCGRVATIVYVDGKQDNVVAAIPLCDQCVSDDVEVKSMTYYGPIKDKSDKE